MKLDRRYYELTFLRFLVSFASEFSCKLDGVILPGWVDGATLAVIAKKNKDRINNFQKPPESTSHVSDSSDITSKNVYEKSKQAV